MANVRAPAITTLMKRIAAPMVGGLATSFVTELLVYPAIYFLWRKRERVRTEARRQRVLGTTMLIS